LFDDVILDGNADGAFELVEGDLVAVGLALVVDRVHRPIIPPTPAPNNDRKEREPPPDLLPPPPFGRSYQAGVVETLRPRVHWRPKWTHSLDIPARTSHHGEMERTYPNNAAVDPVAIPALYTHQRADSHAATVLSVGGEIFELRPDDSGGTSYLWLTGPNPGYGFGSSPTLNWSMDAHRKNIRSFLDQVDPTTGYIEDK
jgi:hypothetical protein